VDENKKETADALADFVPNVIVTHPVAPLDNLALYRQIGKAFGKDKKAELLTEAEVLEIVSAGPSKKSPRKGFAKKK